VEQSSVTLSVTEASSDRDTPECRRAGAVYLSSADNTRSEDRRGRTAPLSCTADWYPRCCPTWGCDGNVTPVAGPAYSHIINARLEMCRLTWSGRTDGRSTSSKIWISLVRQGARSEAAVDSIIDHALARNRSGSGSARGVIPQRWEFARSGGAFLPEIRVRVAGPSARVLYARELSPRAENARCRRADVIPAVVRVTLRIAALPARTRDKCCSPHAGPRRFKGPAGDGCGG